VAPARPATELSATSSVVAAGQSSVSEPDTRQWRNTGHYWKSYI